MTAPGCLDPANCPVPRPGEVDLRRLRLSRLPEGTIFHTAYHRSHWPALFNDSGPGTARFSPINAAEVIVPTLYGAATQTVALLESCFHGVHEIGTKIISERLELATRGLVTLTAPIPLPLVDLSNDGLERIGMSRAHLVATTPEHYACTREWSAAFHARKIGGVMPVGVLWQS